MEKGYSFDLPIEQRTNVSVIARQAGIAVTVRKNKKNPELASVWMLGKVAPVYHKVEKGTYKIFTNRPIPEASSAGRPSSISARKVKIKAKPAPVKKTKVIKTKIEKKVAKAIKKVAAKKIVAMPAATAIETIAA